MKIEAIKTELYNKNMDLNDFIFSSIENLMKPEMVLVITSKLLSISKDLLVNKDKVSKLDLIKDEADVYICESRFGYHLTIKNNLIMPTAGIDQSNSAGHYILLPKNIHALTKETHNSLSKKLGFSNWGLIFSDSKSSPLRLGVTGYSLSYYGFIGLENLKNKTDLHNASIRVTTVNKVDPLAAAAVHLMGESNEQKPIALISEALLTFKKEQTPSLYTTPDNDVYAPLYIK